MPASTPPASLSVDLDRPEDVDETTARVLDAALAELVEFGIRRTTVDSVAQRAGLARMTVYRRFAGKDALVQAVVVREMRRFLATLARSLTGARTVADALESGFAAGVLGWHGHPFGRRIIEREPDAVLPYLTRDAGPALAIVTTFIRAQLAHASDVQRVDPDALGAACEATTRLAQSYALTPAGAGVPTESELRGLARRMILPLLLPRREPEKT